MKKVNRTVLLSALSFLTFIMIVITPIQIIAYTFNHPIESTFAFVGDLLGIVFDFSGDETNIHVQMNEMVTAVVNDDKYKSLFEKVDTSEEYKDVQSITVYELCRPFVFSQVAEINEENIKIVANYLKNNHPALIDKKQMVNFLIETDPFKRSISSKKINREDLYYLYTGYSEITEGSYTPSGDATVGQNIVGYAMAKLGCRYYWGAEGPNYYDCSGLVYRVLNEAGITHGPRPLGRQYLFGFKELGDKFPTRDELEAGDIIFFNWDGDDIPDHLGIYKGDNEFIHAQGIGPQTVGQDPKQCVKVQKLFGTYYGNFYMAARRFH